MSENAHSLNVSVKKRPLWVWLIGLILLPVEVILFQGGFASFWEYEARAAWITLLIAVVILVAYGAFWLRTGTED